MALNAPAGAYTANRLFNTKLRPKGAAKSAFVPTEEETPLYRPAINPHSRKVSSSLISLEDRQFDEQQKKQVRLSQLALAVEGERKANETFAPRTNRTPNYLNMDNRVPLSERAAPNRNLEQPLDPEATHKPKINSENDVNKEQVAMNIAVRKRVRELWSQHAEGTTMSVSGILAALSDLGVKEPGDDATDEALDRYDAVVDKFLAAMGVDESVEDLRYAQYDRFCKVLSTVAKSALNSDRPQPAAAPVRVQNAAATAKIEQLRRNPTPTSTTTTPSSAPRAASAVKMAPKVSNFKKFSNKQFDVEDDESDEEMIAPQRGGPRQSPQPAMTPRQHQPQKSVPNSHPSVSPRGRSDSEAGGPSASLDYFRSPSAQRSNQNARGHFGGMSPSLSPSPALDSVEIHSPSPLNPVSTRRPATPSQHHRDPLASTLVPQQQSAPSPRPQSQSGRSTSRSQPGGGNVPVPQRLGATNKTRSASNNPPSARSQSSEGNSRPSSRSSHPRSTTTDQNASIQRLYSGAGPNSSLMIQEEYSFKPAINPHSNEVERKRAELGGLLRSRMSSKTLERQQRIAREMKDKEVSGCTFAPETVPRRPPTIYKFKDSPSRGHGGEGTAMEDGCNHPTGLPADPPGFDKAIQRMAEGRKRAVPKFEELLRSSIAVTTNSSSARPSTATHTRSTKASSSANPSEIDEAEDNATDTETTPSVTETKPFNLHSQHRVQERKEHRLLLFVDVDLPNGKTGRIGVHRGDDPETLSHNFCVTYSLDGEMKANLCTMLTEKIEVTLRAEEVRKAFSK